MALTISATPVCCTYVVDDSVAEVSIDCTDTAIASTPLGAKSSSCVEGTTILTMGMIVRIGEIFASFKISFYFIRLSI